MGTVRAHLRIVQRDGVTRAGERSDIIKTLNRALAEPDRAPDSGKIVIQYLGALATHAVGWVVTRGLSYEISHRQYLIVDGPGCRTHCIDIGQCEGEEPTPEGAIVDVSPLAVRSRAVDPTMVAVAEADGGRYGADRDLPHDPSVTEAFADVRVRRWEVSSHATGSLEHQLDGTRVIGHHRP